jgi:hypothetical protein
MADQQQPQEPPQEQAHRDAKKAGSKAKYPVRTGTPTQLFP